VVAANDGTRFYPPCPVMVLAIKYPNTQVPKQTRNAQARKEEKNAPAALFVIRGLDFFGYFNGTPEKVDPCQKRLK
jgi:hypothetical protein